MLDWLRKRWASAPVRQPDGDLWADAYTRISETSDRWTVAARADLLVARLSGCFDIAINGNTESCVATKLRLYRKTRSKKKAVGGKRRKFLMGELASKPDAKAISYAQDAGDVEEVTDGPVIEFMHKPNPWMSGYEWAFLRFKAREATGNAYSFVHAEGKAVEAYWMPPQCVRIVADDDSPVAGYRFSRNMTDWLELLPESVFHTKLRPSLQDFRIGDTWVHGIIKQLDMQEAAFDSEYARQRNMQRPDYAAIIKGTSTKDQREEVRKVLRNDHRGPSQAGRAIVLTGDIDLKSIGFAPKDLESGKLFEYIDQIIDRAAGRPESISKLNDASRANAGSGLVQYARHTIQPRQNRDAAELTDAILPLFGLTPGEYFFSYDDCVPEDEMAESTARIAKVTAGVLTMDEARQEEGYEAYPEGLGAVPRVNGVPVQSQEQIDEQRQAQADALAQGGGFGDDDDSEKKKYGHKALAPLPPDVEKEVAALRPKIAAVLRNLAETAPMNPDGTPDLTEFKIELAKALEEDRREQFWRKVEAALLALLLLAGVNDKEAKRRSGVIVAEESAAGNRNLWTRYNTFAVDRIAESTAQQFWRVREITLARLEAEAMAAAQAAVSVGIVPPGGGGMPKYDPSLLDRLGPNATPAQIRAVAAEQAAWQSVLDGVEPRADKIAEYETYEERNLGTLVASDLAAYKWLQWFTFEDDKVCPQCNGMVERLSRASKANPDVPKSLRGKPVQRVDVSFVEEGEDGSIEEVIGPPLHGFCRCTIEAVLDERKLTIEDTAESAVHRHGATKTRLFRMFDKLYREQLEQYRRERNDWRNRPTNN